MHPMQQALQADLPKIVVDWHDSAENRAKIITAYRYAAEGPFPYPVIVTGPSRAGKSTLVTQACMEILDAHAKNAEMPVLKVTLPTHGTEKALYGEILRSAGHPNPHSHTRDHMFAKLQATVRRLGTRMIVIEEVQHAARSRDLKRIYAWGDTLKVLGDELKVPLVLVGTAEIMKLLELNPQLPGRAYAHIPVRPFDWNCPASRNDLLVYLELLDQALPFPELCHLENTDIAVALYRASEGLIGVIAQLVRFACDLARREDAPRIEAEHLAEAYSDLRAPYLAKTKNPFHGLPALPPRLKA